MGIPVEAFAVAAQIGVPVLIWGKPGTGKSTATDGILRRCGYDSDIVTMLLSLKAREDVGGLPAPNWDEKHFTYLPMEDWKRLTSPKSVLKLDELTGAPPDVQSGALEVINAKRAGSFDLGCYVFGICNPPDQTSGGNELSWAMENRFLHLWWEPTPTEFVSFLRKGPSATNERVKLVPANWTTRLDDTKAGVAEFIEAYPDNLRSSPGDNGQPSGGEFHLPAHASDRSWERFAIPFIAAGQAARLTQVQLKEGVAGCVGKGPATSVLNFLKQRSAGGVRIDVDAIIAQPSSIRSALKGKSPEQVETVLEVVNQKLIDAQITETKVGQVYEAAVMGDLPLQVVWTCFTAVQDSLGKVIVDAIGDLVNKKATS